MPGDFLRPVEYPALPQHGAFRAFALTSLAGVAFAGATWGIVTLEPRYAIAVSALVIVLAIAMMSIYWLEDFLLYVLIFHIPFSGFGKWLFVVDDAVTVAKGINFGLAEVLLLIGYFAWFCQIFVARTRSLPRLGVLDALFAILLATQCLSALGAPRPTLSLFDVVYNVKFYLFYFYIAHKIERRHLKIVLALLLAGILVEGPLALYERISGNVGLGRSKGNVAGGEFGTQYEVPGFESLRAEGTTIDSHTLGLYLELLLVVPLSFLLVGGMRRYTRFVMAAVLLIGMGGLIVTFSRAAWISFFLAACVLVCISVFVWRQGRAPFTALAVAAVVSLCYPNVYEYVFVRAFQAESGIMTARYDMNWTALDIIRKNPVLGYGAGNYMEALTDPGIEEPGDYRLPVHNVFLMIAAESGIVSAVAFFALIGVALKRLWRYRRDPDLLVCAFAMAMLAGLIAYVLDGLTNPTFREPAPFSMLWLYFALSVAFARFTQHGQRHVHQR